MAYLRQGGPALKVRTISVATQAQLQQLDKDNVNLADYVVVVPDDMNKTY